MISIAQVYMTPSQKETRRFFCKGKSPLKFKTMEEALEYLKRRGIKSIEDMKKCSIRFIEED